MVVRAKLARSDHQIIYEGLQEYQVYFLARSKLINLVSNVGDTTILRNMAVHTHGFYHIISKAHGPSLLAGLIPSTTLTVSFFTAKASMVLVLGLVFLQPSAVSNRRSEYQKRILSTLSMLSTLSIYTMQVQADANKASWQAVEMRPVGRQSASQVVQFR